MESFESDPRTHREGHYRSSPCVMHAYTAYCACPSFSRSFDYDNIGDEGARALIPVLPRLAEGHRIMYVATSSVSNAERGLTIRAVVPVLYMLRGVL